MPKRALFAFGILNAVALMAASALVDTGVSEAEEKEIVQVHNRFRQQVAKGQVANQPRATNMQQLSWDEELARKAQKIANKMVFRHQKVSDRRWHHVGQNLALSSSTTRNEGAKWPWAVSHWFDEVKKYNYEDPPNSGTGHYTQVVWAQTTRVGCGYASYVESEKRKLKYKKLYVCNYGPGGNLRGKEPYKID